MDRRYYWSGNCFWKLYCSWFLEDSWGWGKHLLFSVLFQYTLQYNVVRERVVVHYCRGIIEKRETRLGCYLSFVSVFSNMAFHHVCLVSTEWVLTVHLVAIITLYFPPSVLSLFTQNCPTQITPAVVGVIGVET